MNAELIGSYYYLLFMLQLHHHSYESRRMEATHRGFVGLFSSKIAFTLKHALRVELQALFLAENFSLLNTDASVPDARSRSLI